MKYITCNAASNIIRITPRRMQQMCKNGEIDGAKKEGKFWMIPEDFLNVVDSSNNSNNNESNSNNKKPLPIGNVNYKEICEHYYYVDKTMIIKDIVDNGAKVNLFTRPRRFGKTLTMDMLKTFFEKTEEDNSIYFKDKLIWGCGEPYQSLQGKYPVIYLSFKDVKCDNYQNALDYIKILIANEYNKHYKVLKLSSIDNEYYTKILSNKASEVDLSYSLEQLSKLLYDNYNSQVVIIIDEYDTPINSGYINGYYDKIIYFMRNLLSGCFKDNQCLLYGFLTGILRVAKESIFSGLNNIKVNTILDEQYSNYFGFTKEEVKDMLQYYHCLDKYKEILDWYDGYRFGNIDIINPWSIINYIANKCTAEAYWVSTSSNDIIGKLLDLSHIDLQEGLLKLINNQTIKSYIDTNIVYSDIESNPYSIYSFMLLTGYLKNNKIYRQDDGSLIVELSIPNKEVNLVYKSEILKKLNKINCSIKFKEALFNKDNSKLQSILEDYLLDSVSIYDGTNESFYHGLMLGLCSILSTNYQIESNKESGLGRFDIELIPTKKTNPAFLFELKYVHDEKELEEAALKALKQIEEKKYDTSLIKNGFIHTIKIGIAFSGKKAIVRRNNDIQS